MKRFLTQLIVGLLILQACGCAMSPAKPVEPTAADHAHPGEKAMLHPYVRQSSDPDWLVRVGQFHGHLGPWVVIGARAGRDALDRLATRGYWDIEVICFMPSERQRQPWSCILDGLQVSTGATLGKQNIRFSDNPQILRGGPPVVLVMTRAPANARRAMAYRVSKELEAFLAGMNPDRLEQLSREVAARPIDWLFEVRSLTWPELKDQFGSVLDGSIQQ